MNWSRRLDDAISFHVELARSRCAAPRHSFAYVIEVYDGWAWQWRETRGSLADAIARIDAWPWVRRRIVCEGMALGEVGSGERWLHAA